jgi:hypothetical protein
MKFKNTSPSYLLNKQLPTFKYLTLFRLYYIEYIDRVIVYKIHFISNIKLN